MKRKFPFRYVAFGLAAAVVVTAVGRHVTAGPQTLPTDKDKAKVDRPVAPRAGVDERTTLPQGKFVAGNGIIEPADREVKVAASVPGRIRALLAKEGEQLTAGAPIAELESGPEKAALDAAEGEVSVSRAELARTTRGLRREDVDAIVADTESLSARVELSKGSLVRIEALAKGGAATPDELDRARTQAESDKRALEAQVARKKAAVAGSRAEDVQVAQARLQAAIGRRDGARAALDERTIRAPTSGEVLQLKVRPGEFVNPQGGDTAVCVMGDTSRLRVRMDVDERDIARIVVGASAFATLNAYPDKRVSAKVVEIGKRMGRKNVRTDDPTERIDTKILEVVLELDDKTGLVPGLRVVSYVATN